MEENDDCSIANVEKKVKELKNTVLKISYEIPNKMNKGDEVPIALMAEQSLKEKQHTLFNKMLDNIFTNPNEC